MGNSALQGDDSHKNEHTQVHNQLPLDEDIPPRLVPMAIKHELTDEDSPLGGVTGSKLVEAANGLQYIAKCDGWGAEDKSATFTVYQEIIGARFAELVGVSVPPFQLLMVGEDLAFGSQRLATVGPTFSPNFVKHPKTANPDIIHNIAVLDCLLHNVDRHPGNILVTMQKGHFYLKAIDHGYAPIFRASPLSGLHNIRNESAGACVQDYLRPLIVDRAHLAVAVRKVQNLTNEEIEKVTTPPSCLEIAPEVTESVFDFLSYRATQIRSHFNRSRTLFPALQEMAL